MIVTTVDDKPLSHQLSGGEAKVIFASSWGTVFERYDFYLYGLLATIISKQFFSGVNETAGFIFALLAFTAGSAVRPFGALFFGRLGDLVGRSQIYVPGDDRDDGHFDQTACRNSFAERLYSSRIRFLRKSPRAIG